MAQAILGKRYVNPCNTIEINAQNNRGKNKIFEGFQRKPAIP